MGRRRIEVEVTFLLILAVIAFIAGKPKDTFFQHRIASVPQRHSKTDQLMAIADAGEAVLVPAIGTRSGMVMRERVPGGPVSAIVLTDRHPGPLAQIGAPTLPMALTLRFLFQTLLFRQDPWVRRGSALTRRGHTTPLIETVQS